MGEGAEAYLGTRLNGAEGPVGWFGGVFGHYGKTVYYSWEKEPEYRARSHTPQQESPPTATGEAVTGTPVEFAHTYRLRTLGVGARVLPECRVQPLEMAMSSFPWSVEIPVPLVVAVMLGLVYALRVSYQRSRSPERKLLMQSRRELRRAQSIVNELEKVVKVACGDLLRHQANLGKFKSRIGKLDKNQQSAWSELCNQVEQILKPTLRLAGQVGDASDQIRHQSTRLMSFAEARVDPLTGVNNRAGLDHALSTQLAEMARYNTSFSVVLFDIDGFKQINDRQGHLEGDRVLREVARLFDRNMREVDLLARYGGDEFVIVAPQTEIEGIGKLSERIRARVEQDTRVTVSGGATSAVDGDTPESLLARADAALYNAKNAGRNCVYVRHDQAVEAVTENSASSDTVRESATACEDALAASQPIS